MVLVSPNCDVIKMMREVTLYPVFILLLANFGSFSESQTFSGNDLLFSIHYTIEACLSHRICSVEKFLREGTVSGSKINPYPIFIR